MYKYNFSIVLLKNLTKKSDFYSDDKIDFYFS